MSEQKNDGGPAFPGPDQGESKLSLHEGMTLRDYFAANAIGHVVYASTTNQGDWEPRVAAKCAYEIADAMLIERTK